MRLLLALVLASTAEVSTGRSFVLAGTQFVLDGKPVQLRSGEMHYSRVHPDYWPDRLARLRALGLNAVATYVPWNFHEETEGRPDFSGQRNLTQFLLAAQSARLLVLLRSGPYMCGEWDLGGLPAWLLDGRLGPADLRTNSTQFMAAVDRFWRRELLPRVRPLVYSSGGPVVMVQVENEYAAYGDTVNSRQDREYIEYLVASARQELGDVAIYTTDRINLRSGTLTGGAVYVSGDMVLNCTAEEQANRPGPAPCFVSESYSGGMSHWGVPLTRTNGTRYAQSLHGILQIGASFNMYMAHGGTSGRWAGANGKHSGLLSDLTSYDFNAPIAEGGEHGIGTDGDKFTAIRQVLAQHSSDPLPAEPVLPARRDFGPVLLRESVSLLAGLSSLVTSVKACTGAPWMVEQAGQSYGLALYTRPRPAGSTIAFEDYPRDRATVLVDDLRVAVVNRSAPVPVELPAGGQRLSIIIDFEGRINVGKGDMWDPKGLGNMTIDGQPLLGWKLSTLPLETVQLTQLQFSTGGATPQPPVFFRGTFQVLERVADTYVNMRGWSKGRVWVNGEPLGRYWAIGPQFALFVPGPILQVGTNELLVLELDKAPRSAIVRLEDKPDYSYA